MSQKFGKILLVDDNKDLLLAARLFLKKHCKLVHTDNNPELIPSLMQDENYDVILLDMNFTKDVTSGMEGFLWLEKILELDPSAVVILITAYGDVEMAVRAIKAGATDFVLKPWQNEKLLATLSAAYSLRHSRLEVDKLRSRQKQLSDDLDQKFHDIIGLSAEMQSVFKTIEKVAGTDANVLILGENGTGKELVARALHRSSQRAEDVFMSVDLGAIPENLFESELFGHEKGAFTDAKSSRPGRFEVASGGTLFLDEIGNIPLPMQAKLLRVLEERKIYRVGALKSIDIDVRLICATNCNLREMIHKGEFRQDLLYRINTVEISLPPLRRRIEDIPLLTEHFLKRYARKYKKNIRGVSTKTKEKLTKYRWQGNIRELQHAIERAVILSDSEILDPGDFFFSPAETSSDELFLENYNIEKMEKTLIRKAIAQHRGNLTQAAVALGISRTSLYRRMDKYGI